MGVLIGTDHAAESPMGFFTRFADVRPLSGLSKRRVLALARFMGAAERRFMKVPAADLATRHGPC